MRTFVFALIAVSTLGLRTNLRSKQQNHCFELCEHSSCEDNTSYETCTSCQHGTYGMDIGDGHVYCLDFCPSGFTEDGCTPPVNSSILESWQFHDNHSYQGERGTQIDIVTGQPAPHYQGFYFNDENTVLKIRDPLTLPLDFTLSSWIMLESHDFMTLFFKDTLDDNGANDHYFATNIVDGHLNCHIEDWWVTDVDKVPVHEWEYIAISVMMNPDARTSTVRFIMGQSNTQSTITATEDGQKFVDFAHGGSTFFGSGRMPEGGNAAFMKGFMFNFHIDNGFYHQFRYLHYGNNLNCSCAEDEACAETIFDCVEDGACQRGTACLVDANTEGEDYYDYDDTLDEQIDDNTEGEENAPPTNPEDGWEPYWGHEVNNIVLREGKDFYLIANQESDKIGQVWTERVPDGVINDESWYEADEDDTRRFQFLKNADGWVAAKFYGTNTYLSCGQDGHLYYNAATIGPNEIFQWEERENDVQRLYLKAFSGVEGTNYVGVDGKESHSICNTSRGDPDAELLVRWLTPTE